MTVLTWNQFLPRLAEFGRAKLPRKWGRVLRRLTDHTGPTGASRAERSDDMPRRKNYAWDEIWYILEGSGIPVDSTEAKRWGAAYDSPLATKLLDLIGLIGETQGRGSRPPMSRGLARRSG